MNNELSLNQLKKYSQFENIIDSEINKFLKKISIKQFSVNDVIVEEGTAGNSILFLIDGEISITQALTLKTNKEEESDNREKELIRINSNNKKITFGEISLFNSDKKRTATVRAQSTCTIGELNFDELFKICESNHSVGYKIMKNISTIITKQLISSNNNVLKLTTAFSLIVDD